MAPKRTAAGPMLIPATDRSHHSPEQEQDGEEEDGLLGEK